MKNVERLNPKKITDTGYYFDIDNGIMLKLTDEEIEAVRSYFQMPTLASKRVIERRRPLPNSQERNYKIAKEQKYNNGKHRKRRNNRSVQGYKRVFLVGTAACMVTVFGTFLASNINSNANYQESGVAYYQTLKSDNRVELPVTTLQYQIPIDDVEIVEVASFVDENAERREWVQRYCDIYQVNFDITYNRLVELTNNFTSEDYLNGHIAGVTCKGEEVYASSEEELILYYVRCVKQIPKVFGIDTNNLYINNGYQSSSNYAAMIGYYDNLLGVDPLLSYSITQAETSWNSDLFLNSNNPAGLRINGHWWNFSTKEEGFIELALEILKYNRMGAYTIEEIGNIHAPEHLDNENWIPNVKSVYNTISNDSTLLAVLNGNTETEFTK